MATEKQFENKVKKFLDEQDCWYIKYWGGAAYTKSGIPDLLVCCNGYFLGIELKGEHGNPSELQLWNIEKIRQSNGIGFVLYPNQFEEFKIFISKLKERPTCKQFITYEEQFKFDKGVKK